MDDVQCQPVQISIHSPHARGDHLYALFPFGLFHFNPLPSCEGRRSSLVNSCPTSHFNPLPSCEGRPRKHHRCAVPFRFQSTPLTRGETRGQCAGREQDCISIHSPHARGDVVLLGGGRHLALDFNPLPSYEGRPDYAARELFTVRFQSTPLIRGETPRSSGISTAKRFQSTPLIRGETIMRDCKIIDYKISIHSPHTRGDRTSPARPTGDYTISIHSPHTRGDTRP